MSITKSKHAFGSEADVDSALQNGLIDAYDILFLSEGKIGWIDKNGNKVILNNKQQVMTVPELPEIGDTETIYIYNFKMYIWDGAEYVSPTVEGGVQDGGYYTPAVTQPAEDTIQFDWTPSKSDMPAVDPIQVTISGFGGNGGYIAQDTAPEDTSLLWIDTDDNTAIPVSGGEAFVVTATATYSDASIPAEADKTNAEIYEAYTSNRPMYMILRVDGTPFLLHPALITYNQAFFSTSGLSDQCYIMGIVNDVSSFSVVRMATEDWVAEQLEQHPGGDRFIVSVKRSTTGTTTADKTSEEIYEAYTQGKDVRCHCVDYVNDFICELPFSGGGDVLCYFSNTFNNRNYFIIINESTVLFSVSDSVLTVNGTAPDENGNVEITIPDSGGNVEYGEENAGKLLYVGADGYATVLALGAGLEIVDGVLTITSQVVTSAICGQAVCGNAICGGA